MNADNLARLFDVLEPTERLALILAAAGRGDEAEQLRLIEKAPRSQYSVPDYLGLAHTLVFVGMAHTIAILDLAVYFQRASGLLQHLGGSKKAPSKGGIKRDRLWKTLRTFAYIIMVHYEGWQEFCAQLNVDGEQLLRILPGGDAVERAIASARVVVPDTKQAMVMIRKEASRETESLTAALIATRLRQQLDEYSAKWP
jgi:hypothetical protein